jgi:hypothetical protein
MKYDQGKKCFFRFVKWAKNALINWKSLSCLLSSEFPFQFASILTWTTITIIATAEILSCARPEKELAFVGENKLSATGEKCQWGYFHSKEHATQVVDYIKGTCKNWNFFSFLSLFHIGILRLTLQGSKANQFINLIIQYIQWILHPKTTLAHTTRRNERERMANEV